MRGVIGSLRRCCSDAGGGLSVLAALVLVAVLGVSALAVEYGHALLQKSEAQRVADLAAYGAGLVYNATGSNASAASAASNIAALNGISSSGVNASVVSSPTGDGNKAVEVNVTSSVPLYLARVLTTEASLSVGATAYAEMKSGSPACIIALSGSGSGVTVSSSAGITADNCSVASNAAVTVNAASRITTKTIDYGTSYSTSGASSIDPPAGTASVTYSKTTTTDPLAASTEVSGATARLGTLSSITSPTWPNSTGSPLSFTNTSMTGSLSGTGCSTGSVGSPWTVNCTGSGPFVLPPLVVTGSASVTFNLPASATVEIGKSTQTCNNIQTGYSICNFGSASLTFAGSGSPTFKLAGGIYNGNSSALTMGSGSSSPNYLIGKAADGNSINAGITSVTLGSNATSFKTAGNITTNGSAALTLPAAAEHDVNGYLSLSASSNNTLGAGIYTVAGYVEVGSSAGASTLTANGVTLVIGGASTPASAPCSGEALCVADASALTLTAPTSGATEDLAVVGPTSLSVTAGALISAAGSSSLSGAVYFPNGAVSVSSASGLGGGSGQCLELIGSQVTVSGASAVGTTCTGLGGSSSGASVALVQ